MTTDGDQIIAALAAADLKWREAKTTLEQRIRKEAEAQLHQLKVARDVLAYQAKQAGETVTRISKEGLHTSATITGYEAIAAGEPYAPKPATEVEQGAQEFKGEGGGFITVTPTEATLAPLLPLLGIEDSFADLDPELLSATFDVNVDQGTVVAATEAWNEEHGVRHPVVALVTGEDATMRRRILEWAA